MGSHGGVGIRELGLGLGIGGWMSIELFILNKV